jgi:peptide/nickel transport system substrate-binding protein
VVPTRGVVEDTEGEKPWAKFIDQGKFGGLLRNAESVLPDHWDLHQSCCNPGPAASRDLFNNLLIYDPTDQLTLVGDLAKSWEWSDDGMAVTFNLWENAVWSDGEPVTADDVVFSLDRMIQKDVSRPRVKNITPYYDGSEAIDPSTVAVNTKFPTPAAFLPFLAVDFMSVQPKHVLEGQANADEFFDDPENIVGSGAFIYIPDSYEIDQGWEFERNPNYFKDGLPFVDGKKTFVIRDKDRFVTAFTTNQIDVVHRGSLLPLIDMVSFKNDWESQGLGVVYSPGFTLQGLTNMKWTAPPFEDPKVRRAVFLAIDRQQLADIDKLGFAKMGQPFFPGSPWASSDETVATWPGFRYVDSSGELYLGDPIGVDGLTKHPDDIAEAKQLMADAGFPDGFSANYHTYTANKNVPVILKQQLSGTLGIDLDIKITDTSATIAAEQEQDFSHFVSVHNGPNIVDPDDLLSGVYLAGAPRNPLDYEDPEIRAIFEKQKSEPDLAKRQALIREAEAIILKGEHHMIQYYWYGDPRWIVPNRVKNYVPRQTVQYGMGVEHLWLEE